jgi:hypothetical protein
VKHVITASYFKERRDKKMGAILPVLARAASFGAVLGIGGELADANSKGKWLVASVVVSVALRATGFYLGAGAAAGAFIGVCALTLYSIANGKREARIIIGGALIGGSLGYLAQLALPLADLRVEVL